MNKKILGISSVFMLLLSLVSVLLWEITARQAIIGPWFGGGMSHGSLPVSPPGEMVGRRTLTVAE